MLTVFRKAESNSLKAVREKYSHAKYLRVFTLEPPTTPPSRPRRQLNRPEATYMYRGRTLPDPHNELGP